MEQHKKIYENEINLLELLEVLVRRKELILKVCALSAVASLLASFALPSVYTSTARVLPPQKEAGAGLSALLGQAGGLAGLAMGGVAGGSDLYIGILKSRSVTDAVIQRLDLMKVYDARSIEEARGDLNNAVKVVGGKDGIISITAEDHEPKRAALLANTLVDELGRTTVRLNLSKAGTERHFLQSRLELVKNDLKNAENDLKAFAQKNKIVQVDSQAKASIEGVARLKSELASKEVQLAVLTGKQTDQSPEVKALRASIQGLKRQLGLLGGQDGGGDGIPAVGNVPGVGLEYSRKLRELKTQEALFEQLTKQYEMAKLSEAKDSSALQILDEAVVPSRKSKPARAVIVVLATFSAFFLTVICLLTQHGLRGLSPRNRDLVDRIREQLRA